jgi:hypothetical protein
MGRTELEEQLRAMVELIDRYDHNHHRWSICAGIRNLSEPCLPPRFHSSGQLAVQFSQALENSP